MSPATVTRERPSIYAEDEEFMFYFSIFCLFTFCFMCYMQYCSKLVPRFLRRIAFNIHRYQRYRARSSLRRREKKYRKKQLRKRYQYSKKEQRKNSIIYQCRYLDEGKGGKNYTYNKVISQSQLKPSVSWGNNLVLTSANSVPAMPRSKSLQPPTMTRGKSVSKKSSKMDHLNKINRIIAENLKKGQRISKSELDYLLNPSDTVHTQNLSQNSEQHHREDKIDTGKKSHPSCGQNQTTSFNALKHLEPCDPPFGLCRLPNIEDREEYRRRKNSHDDSEIFKLNDRNSDRDQSLLSLNQMQELLVAIEMDMEIAEQGNFGYLDDDLDHEQQQPNLGENLSDLELENMLDQVNMDLAFDLDDINNTLGVNDGNDDYGGDGGSSIDVEYNADNGEMDPDRMMMDLLNESIEHDLGEEEVDDGPDESLDEIEVQGIADYENNYGDTCGLGSLCDLEHEIDYCNDYD